MFENEQSLYNRQLAQRELNKQETPFEKMNRVFGEQNGFANERALRDAQGQAIDNARLQTPRENAEILALGATNLALTAELAAVRAELKKSEADVAAQTKWIETHLKLINEQAVRVTKLRQAVCTLSDELKNA